MPTPFPHLNRATLGVILVALALSLASCLDDQGALDSVPVLDPVDDGADGEEAPAEPTIDPNLTVEEDVKGYRLAGRYQIGERWVVFETRRGAAIDRGLEVGIIDLDAPDYEIDIRFLDSDGAAFYLQLGGDGFIDPNWQPVPADFIEPDPVRRTADFAMAAQAMRALELFPVAEELWPERDLLVDLVEALDPEFDGPEAMGESQVESSGRATYTHRVTIRRKDAWFNGSPADHSAVWLRVYHSSGCVAAQFSTSNHGTSASHSSMSTKCTGSNSASWSSIYIVNNICTTAYGIHVCNDDTYVEYQEAKYFMTTNRSTCSNGPMVWAPSCS